MKDPHDPDCCILLPPAPPAPIPKGSSHFQCCSLLMSLFAQHVFPSTSPKERSKGSWSKHISKAQGGIHSPEHFLWMQHREQVLPVLSGTLLLFSLPPSLSLLRAPHAQNDGQWAESWMDQRENPVKGSCGR